MIVVSKLWSLLPLTLSKGFGIAMDTAESCRQQYIGTGVTTKLMSSIAGSNLPTLLNITIKTAAEGLQSGRFTSVDLVKAYLARINEASDFNAVLQVNPDALAAAQQLDDERVHSGRRG